MIGCLRWAKTVYYNLPATEMRKILSAAFS